MSTSLYALDSRLGWIADGVQTVWNFAFSGGYIDRAHVKAMVVAPDGISATQLTLTEGSFIGPNTLTITPAVANGYTLIIYRSTPKDYPLVDFQDGARINETSLDMVARQGVFIAAEAFDSLNVSSETDLALAVGTATTAATTATNAAASATASAAALAAVGGPTGSTLVGWLSPLANAVATTLSKLLGFSNDVSVFNFLTAAEITAVQAGTLVDVTAGVQNAINSCWANGKTLVFPPGYYRVTTLSLYVSGANRGRRLCMRGAGFGEPFYFPSPAFGTVIDSITNAAILRITSDGVTFSTGTIDISGFYFYGSSAAPVIHSDALYGISSIHDNVVYQRGTGSGIQIEYGATSKIKDNYLLNRDVTTFGLGAARSGIGLYIVQNYDAGLIHVIGNTFRGFNQGCKIGAGDGSTYGYSFLLQGNECSVTYAGIWLTSNCRGATVCDNYLEGGEGGVGIRDEGDYNTVRNNFLFPGYGTYISSDQFTYGNKIVDNTIQHGSVANAVLISVTSSSVDGGPCKKVTGNMISFGGSGGTVVGVKGLKIAGSDPRVDYSGNMFFPRGNWIGGAGTLKLDINSTASSDGTTGTGMVGLGFAQSSTKARELPLVSRGVVNLAVEPVALTNANITAGVLNVGELCVQTLTPTANVAITSIGAANLPDKTFSIHVTPTAFAVTFTNGALLKLAGGANLVTGANGCWINFQVKPGGVVWETSRVIY